MGGQGMLGRLTSTFFFFAGGFFDGEPSAMS